MSRLELLVVVGLTFLLGGVLFAVRATALGAGLPGLEGTYRAVGLSMTAAGIPALCAAGWRGPPAAGGSGRRIW